MLRKFGIILTLLISFLSFAVFTPASVKAATDSGPTGGVLLDGYGGLHQFGGLNLNTSNYPYWPNWDIARAIQTLPDASGGWTLDGFGGIHAWGNAPAVATPAYWSGWDIARAFYMLPDQHSGYLLDGWGGVHAFGPNAPTYFLGNAPYWRGWDIAKGLDIHVNTSGVADGGVTLDGWGGLHPFGNYPLAGGVNYYPGHVVYQQIHSVDGKQYTYQHWGVATGISGGLSPYWSGLPSWNGWDIERDIQLFGSNNPNFQNQPLNAYDWNEYLAATGQPSDVGYRPECGVGSGARNAGARVAAVSIECQATTLYVNGQPYLNAWVTTGRASYPTPRGWFHVQWKRSPWWVLPNYPATHPSRQVAMAVAIDNQGDLFHDSSWEPDSQYGQTSTLGTSNASHGCIHMKTSNGDMQNTYNFLQVGDPVWVN